MKVPKNYDVQYKTPDISKGTNPFDNPGIMPSKGNIADTPGERATNDPACEHTDRKQPFGSGGSGYTSKS